MPSAYRTLKWQPVPPVGFISGPSLTWPDKHQSELLDYSLDLSTFLNDASFDTVAAATITATPNGLVIGAASSARGIVSAMIGGGAPGQTYTVKVAVTTTGGLVAEFDAGISVT